MLSAPHVVLVLSNQMDVDGTLNDQTAARVEAACQVMRDANADYLFFIGWDFRPDSKLAIADAMNLYRQSLIDLAEERILIDRTSRDSVGDAIFSRLKLDALFGSYNISVVSSWYHVPRLRIVFDRVYGDVATLNFHEAPAPTANDVEQRENASVAAFEKTFRGIERGDIAALTKRLLADHPLYNGEHHPAVVSVAGATQAQH